MMFLRHSSNWIAAAYLLVLIFILGCASVANLDPTEASIAAIKRVAVLGIHEPKNVTVMNIGGAAGAFGVIGGLPQGGTNADHSRQFVEALLKQKQSLSESLQTAITQSLKEGGFQVTVAADQKPKLASDGKSDDYSDVNVDADAILSVWFRLVGYLPVPGSSLWC